MPTDTKVKNATPDTTTDTDKDVEVREDAPQPRERRVYTYVGGSLGSQSVYGCPDCGALVIEQAIHDTWHTKDEWDRPFRDAPLGTASKVGT